MWIRFHCEYMHTKHTQCAPAASFHWHSCCHTVLTAVGFNCSYQNSIAANGVEQHEETDLGTALESADVCYVTRIQKERFDSEQVPTHAA